MQTIIKLFSIFALSLLLSACQPQPPAFIDQNGQPLDLAEHWLVINYWATWCKPCRKEVPELNQLHQSLTQQPIKILGVNFDQLKGDALVEASDSLGIHFPVLSQDPAKHFSLPSSQGLPVTHIVNPQGTLAATLLGEQTEQSIRQRLLKLGAIKH